MHDPASVRHLMGAVGHPAASLAHPADGRIAAARVIMPPAGSPPIVKI
ncbi:hypothetical protein [Gluconacetobacter azotocaptans]|nr:hypothetical protein [Gluconacetobacter azotocaptans]